MSHCTINYTDCDFYYTNIEDFDGCPGLDFQGDDDDCGDCPYRLSNFKECLRSKRSSSVLVSKK